jgi:hypothetical protein
MIRTVITPQKQDVSIRIPQEYIGKQVEVIAFAIDETVLEGEQLDKVQTHFASEKTLAKDWLTKEEDEAWKSL